VVEATGNRDLTLLVCTSSYPSNPLESHINRIETLRQAFGCKVGLSDHTLGIGVSIAAIALGATAIEKHLTLRRSDGGADGAFSMEPEEFAQLVEEGNKAAAAMGDSEWRIQDSEKESRRIRRSLYIVQDVKENELVTHENVKALRPGGGGEPKNLQKLIGKRFKSNFTKGSPANLEIVVDE
jgi:N-acetylneuraminate synthase